MSDTIPTEEQLERFNADLVALFEKHHLAILWETDHIVRIDSDAHILYLGRGCLALYGEQELVYPVCSKLNLDDIVNLEDDDDELSKPE